MIKEILNISTITSDGAVRITETDQAYLLNVGKKGGSIFFHGEPGHLGGIPWTKDKYISLPIRYDEPHSFYFHLNFYGTDGTFVEADFATHPYLDVHVSFPLTFLDLETVFMPRTPGRLKNMMHGTPQKAEEITKMELWIPESSTDSEIIIGKPYLTDENPSTPLKAPAQVDVLGQWTVKDWQGKTENKERLIADLQDSLDATLLPFAKKLSPYGGDLSMKRQATGYFRIHEEDGTYWFCDPDGCLMFASGIDLISPEAFCPITDIDCLFEELPPRDGLYEDAWQGDSVSFHIANLIHAFGADWHESWKTLTTKRLKSWGFTGVGNWSMDYAKGQEIAYFVQNPFPVTERTLFRSMPDVFSQEYADNAAECAKALESTKEDPYLVGYFLRNEPDWAFGTYNMAGIMLEKNEDFASKDVFIDKMSRKYDTIDAFNKAWHLDLKYFNDLRKPIEKPWLLSEQAEKDLHEFTRDIIREYIRVPSIAYKKVDPNHLNLGLRWGWLENEDLCVASEYFDVFSINNYKETPEADLFELIHKLTGLPIVIGEFQVGSLDVGLPSNSMFGVTNQSERGIFYQRYMEHAAKIPYLIGAHYFQWNDQPTLGRFDGENLNIGAVDVCNKPYEAFIEGMKRTHMRLNDVHAGKIPPTENRSNLVPKEGF